MQSKNSLCSWTTVVTITVQYTVQLPKENQSCQNVEFAAHSLGNWQFHLTPATVIGALRSLTPFFPETKKISLLIPILISTVAFSKKISVYFKQN